MKYYGGPTSLIKSPYVHLSAFLTAITFKLWLVGDWSHEVLSVMPPILGFSIGGFAMFVSFGADAGFIKILSGDSETGKSPYLTVTSTFMHFILVQTFSILYAVVGGALDASFLHHTLILINSVGVFMFIYGLSLVISAALMIFKVSIWHDDYSNIKNS
jgi:hypothetical protein